MKYPKLFLIFRRRLAKAILKIMGWKFRGQDPPSVRHQIIFINEIEGEHSSKQRKWMRHLTASASYFLDLADKSKIEKKINQHATLLIKWTGDMSNEDLVWLLELARTNKIKLSACAWESADKTIKFHSQFKPSPYTERDINYLERFFVFFRKI